ncbi:MAG: hypothetical protein HEQ39_11510 [Rhizobacter sp.]
MIIQVKSPTAPLLLADASAIGMGWSKPRTGASDSEVKSYLGQVLSSLTGGKIQSIDRLPEYAAGQRRSQLEASLNKEVASASGGRLTSWRQLLSAGSRELLERQTASSNPPANKPAPSNAPWKIGGVDVGAVAREGWNRVKNVPNPLLGGLTPNQAGQVLKGGINAGARTINQTVRAPVLPVAEPASSFESVRARADSWVARASKGKFDSVADLVHFAGDNKAANRLRGQVTQMLQKDAAAQAGGFSNWKQVLTAAERGQLERTLVETQKLPSTQPNTPKQQQAWAGQALQQVQKLPTPKSERGPLDTLRNVVGGAWDQFAGDTFKAEIEQLKKIVRDPSRLIKPIDDIKNWLESDPKGQWNNAIATWGRVFSHPPEKWAEAYKAELMKQPQTQMLREFSNKVRNDRDFQEQLAGRGLGLIAQVIVTRKVTKALQGNPGSAIQPIKQTPTAVATAGQGGLRLQAIKETLRSLGNEVTPSHVVKKLRQYMIDITDDLKTTPKGTARYKELADIRAQLDQRLNGRLKPTAVVPQTSTNGVNQATPATVQKTALANPTTLSPTRTTPTNTATNAPVQIDPPWRPSSRPDQISDLDIDRWVQMIQTPATRLSAILEIREALINAPNPEALYAMIKRLPKSLLVEPVVMQALAFVLKEKIIPSTGYSSGSNTLQSRDGLQSVVRNMKLGEAFESHAVEVILENGWSPAQVERILEFTPDEPSMRMLSLLATTKNQVPFALGRDASIELIIKTANLHPNQAQWAYDFCQRRGLVMDIRPLNPAHMQLEPGSFTQKPEWIKAKSTTQLDRLLGIRNALGLVTYRREKFSEAEIDRAAAQYPDQADALRARAAKRNAETAKLKDNIDSLIQKGMVTLDENGLLRDARIASPSKGKPFGPDVDGFAIYNARTGQPIRAYERKGRALAQELANSPLATQHGFHMPWLDEMLVLANGDAQKTQDSFAIFQEILGEHASSTPLVRIMTGGAAALPYRGPYLDDETHAGGTKRPDR